MSKTLKEWKNPAILLTSLSIAGTGDFIYLVAINIMVYQMTGSAAAVAGLWIVGPIVNILTKFWTGSFIDYRSKKKILMTTYLLRAGFIALIPFASSVFGVYLILIFLAVAKAFYGLASVTYITMLVPREKRKRFNSIQSVTSSGAFIVGPAIAGTLILMSSVESTLWMNSVFFVVAAILFMKLPEGEIIDHKMIPPMSLTQVRRDFTVVKKFFFANSYIAFIYLSFSLVMIFTFAMDAQEVVFTQKVIGLSEVEYSLLISITGIGSVVGGVVLSIFSSKLSLRLLISLGILMASLGYVVYAFSWSFLSITVGFVILGFFLVFLNAGMSTFYQNNIPVTLMGRVTSIFQLMQSSVQVIFIVSIGVIADVLSLRVTIVVLALLMLFAAIVFSVFVLKAQRASYYQEEEQERNVYIG